MNLPQKMKASVIRSYGSPQEFSVEKVSVPEIRSKQVLLEVHASSVNPIDCYVRQGKLKYLSWKGLPKILGADVAGKVVEIGSAVKSTKVGDRLYGMVNPLVGGAYAQYIAVNPDNFAEIPENLDYTEAAATPTTAITALRGLKDKAKVSSNKKVMIIGAAGGVGSFAVSLAHAFDAVVTAVSAEDSKELVMNLGADVHVDYQKKSLTEIDEQFDIIFDTASVYNYFQVWPLLNKRGIFVRTVPNASQLIFMLLSRVIPLIPVAKICNASPDKKSLNFLNEMFANWEIKPLITKIYPLKEVAEAHKSVESGHNRGKTVIQIR
jgi:NADPH:quinone reductase-like Zn-dependent oxidoreductase